MDITGQQPNVGTRLPVVEVKTGSKGKEAFQRPLRVTRAFTPTPASVQVTMPNDFLNKSSWYSHCQPLCSLTYSLYQSPRFTYTWPAFARCHATPYSWPASARCHAIRLATVSLQCHCLADAVLRHDGQLEESCILR